jgi:hypothetical protein
VDQAAAGPDPVPEGSDRRCGREKHGHTANHITLCKALGGNVKSGSLRFAVASAIRTPFKWPDVIIPKHFDVCIFPEFFRKCESTGKNGITTQKDKINIRTHLLGWHPILKFRRDSPSTFFLKYLFIHRASS